MFLLSNNFFLCLSLFFLIVPLPFSLSLYLPDSNPLLSFNNQVREVHLYTGNSVTFFQVESFWSAINVKMRQLIRLVLVLDYLKRSLCWFLSFLDSYCRKSQAWDVPADKPGWESDRKYCKDPLQWVLGGWTSNMRHECTWLNRMTVLRPLKLRMFSVSRCAAIKIS